MRYIVGLILIVVLAAMIVAVISSFQRWAATSKSEKGTEKKYDDSDLVE